MKKFTTTITQANYNMKKEDQEKDGVFREYKSDNEYWNKRTKGVRKGATANFLVGSKPMKHKVVRIFKQPVYAVPDRYRGWVETALAIVIECE